MPGSIHLNERGFSFLELLESLTLFAVGVLGLCSLTIGSIHGNSVAKQVTSATVVGQDKIEQLRGTAYAAIADGFDQVTVTGVLYDREWTVCNNCPMSGTKEISVVVSWPGQASRVVELETIVAK